MIEEILNLDQRAFIFLNNLGTESWDPFWIFISNKFWMFFLLAPIILFYNFYNHGKQGIYVICMLLLCFFLTDLVHVHLFKNVFMRLRPCWDPEISSFSRIVVSKGGIYSFVSGHAANSAAIVSFFLLSSKHIHKLIQIALIIWVLIVSYSRIYLGKHYPLDVIFGIVLGASIAFLIFKITFYIKNIKK